MSDSPQDLPQLLGDLARTVETLQSELEPDGRGLVRPPTPREFARLTSEVTIPAIILVLKTNIRTLQLLQQTLRLATNTEPEGSGTRQHAQALGRETLSRLDDALTDLQAALAGRPSDDRARELIEEARSLRAEIDDRLTSDLEDGDPFESERPLEEPEAVDVDVESELQSIKDNLDDRDEEE